MHKLLLSVCFLLFLVLHQTNSIRDGSTTSPSLSCRDIWNYNQYMVTKSSYLQASVSGVYRLQNPSTGTMYDAFCDMASGGWTLIMKQVGSSGTLTYSSSHWTTTSTLNAGSTDLSYTDAKFEAYNHVPYQQIRMTMRVDAGSYGGTVTENTLQVTSSGTSMLSRIQAGTALFDTQLDQSSWLALAGPRAGLQYHCNNQGYNMNGILRLGIMSNQENDCATCDSFIGMGGAFHWTAGNPVTCPCAPFNPPSYTHYSNGMPGNALLWIRETFDCSSVSFCSGNGRCTGTGTCTCFTGWGGNACATPICNTRLATDPAVCSGRGVCYAPDSCSCTSGHAGANCEDNYRRPVGTGTWYQPGRSCFEIYNTLRGQGITPTSGIYFLYSGSYYNTYQVYCDMTSNGGGWTMVMKMSGSSSALAFDAPQWHTTATLNTGNNDLSVGDAKYLSFNTVPFTQMMLRMQIDATAVGGPSTTNTLIREKTARSMLEIFDVDDEQGFDNVGTRPMWRDLAGPFSSLNSNCNREVFNYKQLRPSNGPPKFKLRIGFVANDANDCFAPKSWIGFGSSHPWNNAYHGNLMWCNCAPYDNGFKQLSGNGWIFVRENFDCTSNNFCSGHGRCTANAVCTCDAGWSGSSCSTQLTYGSSGYPASSCRAIQAFNPSASSGNYHISYSSSTIVQYCAFPTGYALISSFSLANVATFRSHGFNVDFPRSVASPNFLDYRLSLANMQNVIANSQEFFITCNADLSMTRDFIYGLTSESSLFSTGEGFCIYVRGTNIRGFSCSNCNIRIWNSNVYHWHVDSTVQTCSSGLSISGSVGSEDNFGYYIGVNNAFTCTATSSSTTNYWARTRCSHDICNGRGTCDANNNCVCRSGYSGTFCEQISCFGKTTSDPTVCGGAHAGTCVAPDVCICNNGYSGSSCGTYTCNDVLSSSPAVCNNGNGTCIAFNNCQCSGYVGINCEIPLCNGIPGNASTVCNNRNGTCTRANICACNSGYQGAQCQIPICYSIPATSSAVCSNSNGTCTSANNCVCNANYVGAQCQTPVCFGIQATSSSVCSTNGTCVRANMCNCNSGFFGSQCESYNCYGTLFNSGSVCSGHGRCIHPDQCSCNTGYTGNTCNVPICFGVLANQPNVCNFLNGSCSTPDRCICNTGYTGNSCEIPICHGFSANDTRTCNFANGTCIRRDTCRCSALYTGARCEVPICYGIIGNSSSVCSTNGTCIRGNTCNCNVGYYGSQCERYNCNGVVYNDGNVCSGHGFCSTPDRCICNPGYTGVNCEIPICFSVLANDTRVCTFSNGTCTSPNNCVCNTGYTGVMCQTPICYSVHATSDTVCNFRNGTCATRDNCICAANYIGNQCEIPVCYGTSANNTAVCRTNGTCTRANNCVCKAGFYGLQCENYDCFTIRFNNISSCSAHGNCLAPNVCSCINGYIGVDCSIPVCYGFAANDSRSCSFRNGTCTLRDNCVCDIGYTGNQCEIPICYGKVANSSTVCSFRNGTCVSRDRCVCANGYIGNQCEIPICFGIPSNSSMVCSYSNGTCTRRDNCNCNPNYSGSQCETPICYGLHAFNERVCNYRNGTCTKANTCICKEGYVGDQCQVPICFGLLGNTTAACGSNNGTCVKADLCVCSNGYAGEACNIPICYGFTANDSRVCSRNGTCIFKDLCSCTTNYVGNTCEIPLCFGVRADEHNRVCSTNGTCIRANTCLCKAGFFGNQCENFNCHSIHFNNTDVCSRHGRCIHPDSCSCAPGYTGYNCQLPICFGINSSNSQVCSGHGTCFAINSCACGNGYTGAACNIPICYGRNASDSHVCSSHGACLAPNNCSCANGYFETNCSGYTCNTLHYQHPTVCSSHGSCSDLNKCECQMGYSGASCQWRLCGGIPHVMPNVCSAHGQCIAPFTCSCGFGYVGPLCDNYSCNNVAYSNHTVCSRNGNCTDIDTCVCKNGFTGFDCQHPVCFGVAANDPFVCNRRGICQSTNNCTCFSQYSGQNCERVDQQEHLCYGISALDRRVCSSNGRCIAPDTCECSSGFTGLSCANPVCYNFTSTNSFVCNGRGSCIAPNNCSCAQGYFGPNCEIFSCFGNMTNVNNCVRGKCIDKDKCLCEPGYAGARCEQSVCFSRSSSDRQVCSSHGICVGPNLCSCHIGYYGSDCRLFNCFGLLSTDSRVCNRNGSCTQPDTCICNPGFGGISCEPTCYGLLASSSAVCSNQGSCIGFNRCNCTNPFRTGDCSQCIAGRSGATCTDTVCSDAICNFRGACNGGVCQCSGNWASPFCEKCLPGYVGANCNAMCNSSSTCSGNGECMDSGACMCYRSTDRGYWSGVNCEQCLPNWYGRECKTFISQNFTFDDSADRIFGAFTFANRQEIQELPCDRVVHADDLSKIGARAKCWWPSPTTDKFEIVFGSGPTLLPYDTIRVRTTPSSMVSEVIIVIVLPPANVTIPIASLKSPPKSSECEDFILDATNSFSTDRRAKQYLWNALSGYRITALNEHLNSQHNGLIRIPSSLIESGFEYEIQVAVRNYLNITSAPTSVKISKHGSAMPIVSIEGPPIQYTTRANVGFRLIGNVISRPCQALAEGDTYIQWKQTRGPFISFRQMQRDIVLENMPFSTTPYTAEFTFSASLKAVSDLSASVSVQVIVQPVPLVARILGGNSRVVGISSTVVLDARASFDPESNNATELFSWNCVNILYNGRCNLENFAFNASMLAFPAVELGEGSFNFSVIFTKDGRSSESFTLVNVLADDVTVGVVIDGVPNELTRNSTRVVARATLNSENNAIVSVKYQWAIVHELASSNNIISQLNIGASTSDRTILFTAATLLEGHTYRVTVNVSAIFANGRRVMGYSSVLFVVLPSPLVGLVNIAPSIGFALSTEFVIQCEQFRSEYLPLEYSFGYIDRNDKIVSLNFFSQSNTVRVKLPQGSQTRNNTLSIVAVVKHAKGASIIQYATVTVLPPNVNNMSVANYLTIEASSISTSFRSQKDVSIVTQLISSTLEMLNEQVVLVSERSICSSVSNAQACPNNCSSAGRCVAGECVCDTQRRGRDCSIDIETFTQRENARYIMIQKVIESVNNTFIELNDTNVLRQLVLLAEKLASIYEELNIRSQTRAIEYMEIIMQAPVTNDLIPNLFNIISYVSSSFEKHRANGTISTSDEIQISRRITNLTSSLAKKLSVISTVGEKPHLVDSKSFALISMKKNREAFGSAPIRVCPEDSSAATTPTVVLPKALYELSPNADSATSISKLGVAVPNEVAVQLTMFSQNPYSWSPTSKAIASNVIRVQLLGEKGSVLKLRGLTDPLTISVPVQGEAPVNKTYVCKYWNETLSEWANNGCIVSNRSNNSISCACTHTTDFSVFLEDVTVDPVIMPNIRSLEEWPMYVAPCSAGGLLIMWIAALIFGLPCDCKKYIPKELGQKQHFRKLMYKLGLTNLLLSLVNPSAFYGNSARAPTRAITVSFIYVNLLMLFTANLYIDLSRCTSSGFIPISLCEAYSARWLFAGIAIAIIISPIHRVLLLIYQTSQVKSKKSTQPQLKQTELEDLPINVHITENSLQQSSEYFGSSPQSPIGRRFNPLLEQAPPSPVPIYDRYKVQKTMSTVELIVKQAPKKSQSLNWLSVSLNTTDNQMQEALVWLKNKSSLFTHAIGFVTLLVLSSIIILLGFLVGIFFPFIVPQASPYSLEISLAVAINIIVLYITCTYLNDKYLHSQHSLQFNKISLIVGIVVCLIFTAAGSIAAAPFYIIPLNTSISLSVLFFGFVICGVVWTVGTIRIMVLRCKSVRPTKTVLPWIFKLFVLIALSLLAIGCNTILVYFGLQLKVEQMWQWVGGVIVSVITDFVLNILYFVFIAIAVPIQSLWNGVIMMIGRGVSYRT